ncbi:hypothetical protein D3C81_1938660 [compost metagenome]
MPLEGVGPRIVEHVLAARMRFQVEGHGGGQRCAAPQREVVRRPAGAARRAAGFVQGVQEGVPQEGLVPRQRVPLAGVDAGQIGFNGQARGIHR